MRETNRLFVCVFSFTLATMPVFAADRPVSGAPTGALKTEGPDEKAAAVDFVKSFPIRQTAFPRCPTRASQAYDGIDGEGHSQSIDKIMSWKKVRTIQDELLCRPLAHGAIVLMLGADLAYKNGGGDKMPRYHGDDDADTREFNSYLSAEWSARKVHDRTYVVEVHSAERPSANEAPQEQTDRWRIDLETKTLRPLNYTAWAIIDLRKAISWGTHSERVANSDARSDISTESVAPVYRLQSSRK